MIYVQSLFFIVSFLFLCIFINTLFSLAKAKMYPPKNLLKQRAFVYIGIAFFFFITAWLLRHV
jgi:hypothetical protein